MRVQEWIHRMEVGAGATYVRWTGIVVGFVLLAVIYNLLCFRNFTHPEAMDAAQLGRNIAHGEGFTTKFVRPLSVGLTREARDDKSALLTEGHRDISNAPLYPLLLAGVLAVTPDAADMLEARASSIYWPNLYIAVFNQILLALGAALVFHLAQRWFNRYIGWIAAILFLLTELYWRFSISGLSTVLLMDLVLLLVLLLCRFEQKARENEEKGLSTTALGIGAVAGLAMLTRYSAGWLIVPVMGFVIGIGGTRRLKLASLVIFSFALLTVPWVVRNVLASGLPFGTATYALVEGTPVFPSEMLQRSFTASLTSAPGEGWSLFVTVLHKGVKGLREIITSDLPRVGGNWLWGFFLAGLLVRFQAPNLSRLRWFVVAALLVLIPVQSFARNHLAPDLPDVNADNLLVVLSPLILIFGVGLFFVLLESIAVPSPTWRMGATAAFVVVISLPLLLAFLPPRGGRNTAPYYPPRLQQIAQYLEPGELWMSDIPWAMAWYGDRQTLWLTRNSGREFFEVNDYYKSVNGLYISTRTGDARFVSHWLGGPGRGWAGLMLQTFVERAVPKGFPLRHSPEGLASVGELLLTDRDRWSNGSGSAK